MNPAISVIMPVYNTEKYLRECLDSVCAQTLKDIEIICVDDGSTDSSPAILAEYAAKDKRFKILTREHSNAGACRNAGMDIARGEFLSFLDSDDVFAPKMLEILHDAVEKHGADIASCNICQFRDGTGVPCMAISKEPGICIYDNPAQNVDTFHLWVGRPWDKLFRKSYVAGLDIRFQEQRSANDEFFIDVAVASSHRIIHIDEVMIAYRQHSSSLQATQHKDPHCMVAAVDAIFREMKKRGLFADNPPLYNHFRGWVSRVIRQLKRISTVDAYEKLFNALKKKIAEHNLERLTQEETHLSEEDYKWFRIMASSCEYPSALMAETLQLRTENRLLKEELWGLRSLSRRKWDFRIGKMILFIPRKLKKLMKCAFGAR